MFNVNIKTSLSVQYLYISIIFTGNVQILPRPFKVSTNNIETCMKCFIDQLLELHYSWLSVAFSFL